MRSALLISATMHALVGVLFWSAASRASDLPKLRVYAVDIVSPPPQELGEFDPLPGAEPEPVNEPAPEPEPQPEPEPEPPAPTPQPAKVEAAPVPKPKKEEPAPVKKPEPKKPEPPKEQPPKKEPPKEAPKKETSKEAPKKDPPKETVAKPADKPTPSRGASPSPGSAGGENLDVKIEGARFVDPGYLANIQRQVHRYFRRPGESRADVAEVRFYINRDGSVADIEVVRHAGSFAFRVAAMEAVEQAGLNKSFGPLPKEYPSDRLLVSFYFRLAR